MKHWQELASIAERLVALERDRCRAALAIVTQIKGSAYRRPGARLLIDAEGNATGGVSGGCLEEDVRQVGLQVIASQRGRVLNYDTRYDATKILGLGLGCDGEVQIQVLPVLPEAVSTLWTEAQRTLRANAPVVLTTALDAEGRPACILTRSDSVITHWDASYLGSRDELGRLASSALLNESSELAVLGQEHAYHDWLQPPPVLLVCGAGDDAQPLVTLGATLGFRVTLVDHRAALLSAVRFPQASGLVLARAEHGSAELMIDARTYGVVKMHSLEHDTGWVRRLIASPAAYIGVLGPERRLGRITQTLGSAPDDRLHGPVGLDLGADGPEQVALSILSEILAVRAKRQPSHLREVKGPLHQREALTESPLAPKTPATAPRQEAVSESQGTHAPH